jgi:hypothetical protein
MGRGYGLLLFLCKAAAWLVNTAIITIRGRRKAENGGARIRYCGKRYGTIPIGAGAEALL